MLAVGKTLTGDPIRPRVLLHFVGADRIDPGGVQPENLGTQGRSDLSVAVLCPQLGRDLKSAKCLDLILGRTIPDGVCAPEHVILTAVLDELAQRMRRAVGITHEEAPGTAELSVNIA